MFFIVRVMAVGVKLKKDVAGTRHYPPGEKNTPGIYIPGKSNTMKDIGISILWHLVEATLSGMNQVRHTNLAVNVRIIDTPT